MSTSHSEPPIKVMIYDDNADIRSSLSTLLGLHSGFEVIGAYPDANQIIENCQYLLPHVILMDIDMPGLSGIEAVSRLREHFALVKVLMLTVFDDNDKIFESICNGAVGYILKKTDPSEILNAVREAYLGGAPISPSIAAKVLTMFRRFAPNKPEGVNLNDRELRILTLLTKGYSYKMMASACDVSLDTIRFHIKKIYEKLHVHSMTEAVSKALKNKWV